MTDYGETDTGFRRKTFAEIQASIRDKLRRRIDARLTLDELDWVGNLVDVFSDELDLGWQALEVARNGFDPANSEGSLMIALAALTGTRRRDPTYGTVDAVVGLAANKTFAPGELVAHVWGDPGNRWVNRDEIASTASGDYPAVFVAEAPGSYPAIAGTLIVIAASKTGWRTITNPTDATPGRELESIDDLRVRREEDLETQASGTAGGIRSDVLDVEGVTSARVLINDTETDQPGLPKHSVRVIVWDGLTEDADDDAIAQAILETKGAATTAIGASSGVAVDAQGDTTTVPFDRAVQTLLYVDGELEIAKGADSAAVIAAAKEAIIAGGPTGVGQRAVFERIKSRSFSAAGVTDVLSFALGAAPGPTETDNVEAAVDEILILDSSTITLIVTEQP